MVNVGDRERLGTYAIELRLVHLCLRAVCCDRDDELSAAAVLGKQLLLLVCAKSGYHLQ